MAKSSSQFFYCQPEPTQPHSYELKKSKPSSIDELQLRFSGQANLINAMRAFGYNVDLKGVCFGLSASARDAFLSDNFTVFLKEIDTIDQIYKSCIQEATDKLTHLQKQAQIIIHQNFVLLNQTIDMAFNVSDSYHPEFYLSLNDSMLAIQTATAIDCILNETLKNEPGSPFSLLVNYIFTSRIDVVTEAKFTILKSIADNKGNKELSEFCDGLSFRDLATDLRLIFINKEKEVENTLKYLNMTSGLKSTVIEAIKNISPVTLYSLNIIKAFFDRIMCYQNPYHFPDIFPHLDSKHKKTFEAVYPLVETQELSCAGSITQVYSLSGCYTYADLVQYFHTLKVALASFKHLVGFTLGSTTHAMFMGYNPLTQTFTMFDPNNKVIESSDEHVLATYVCQGFSFRAIAILVSPQDNYNRYRNTYLYILNTQKLAFCDSNGKFHPLIIHDKVAFQNALHEALLRNDQSQDDVIKKAISKNINHSGLGSPYTVFFTDVWQLSTHNTTQLHDAMHYWHTNSTSSIHAIKLIKVQATDQNNGSWLQLAILIGDTDLITKILATRPQTTNSEIFTSLVHTSSEIQKQLFALNPLTLAASTNYYDFYNVLLNTAQHPNQIIFKNITALHAAVYCQNLGLIHYLLAHNADPDYKPVDFIHTARQTARLLQFDDVNKIFAEYDAALYKQSILLKYANTTLGRFFNYASQELLFQLIEIGDIQKAGTLIYYNPRFLTTATNYTDQLGRTLIQIKPLQYALWLLNADMWNLIIEYLSIPILLEQFEEHESGILPYARDHNIFSEDPLSEINQELITQLRAYLKDTYEKYLTESEPSTPTSR